MTAKRVLIISPEQGLASCLQEKLAAAPWADVAVAPAYPSAGQLRRLVHEHRPAIVLVALTEPTYALSLIEELHVSFPGVLLAATHSVNLPDLIMSAIRAGASEYLGPPFEVEYLERVLEQKQDLLVPLKPKGRMVTIVPAAGGCGASTVAIHLAAWMARQTRKKVLLFDWDLHCGTTAFRLRLKPEFTLADALERSGALDEFWGKLVSSWKGIDLLPPAHPDRVSAEDLGRVPAVINSAKRTYDWVVSDLPPAVFGGMEPVIEESEGVFLVCTPDLVSMHLARRRCEELRRLGLGQDVVKLVVNREVGVNYKPEEIRSLVGTPVARTLPNDYRSVNAAWIEGRLVADNCDLGKLLQRFALDVLAGAEPTEQAAAKRLPVPKFLQASTA
jgi:pilus assembly protein CpaE